jgi:hypothetical protein
LEKHKSKLLEINLLKENALNEHARLNKEKGLEVHLSTKSCCGHLDEIARLRDNRYYLRRVARSS